MKIVEVKEPAAPATVIFVGVHDIEVKDSFLLQIHNFLEREFRRESLKVRDITEYFTLDGRPGFPETKKEGRGLTTQQYILQYRLDRAAGLLLQTDKTISEIALEIGLKDLAHFSRAFKEQYGQSPLVFRQHGRIKPD